MAGAGSKRNLSAAEQVAFLRNEKGVSFSLASEADAVKILSHGICLYRLKAYAADFDTYHEKGVRHGRYIGLDFGHLVELEVLDSRLRTLVLSFCLDIEEALKVRINRAAMEAGVDPYALTRGYLEAARAGVVSDQLVRYDREAAEPAMSRTTGILAGADPSDPAEAMDAVNAAMAALADVAAGRDPNYVLRSIEGMSASTYSGGIVRRYPGGEMPYWCLLELLSFGPLTGFYRQCFKRGGLIDSPAETALLRECKSMLRQAQGMRNAAAHNDAMLNTLLAYRTSSYLKGCRRKLRERGVEGPWVDAVASVPVAMELAAVLMCHESLVERAAARGRAASGMRSLSERLGENAGWFTKSYPVSSFIGYASRILREFAARAEA